jgi:pyruvate dehydrogenase E1 component alpha subunit/2-oxoisovalerate dehydrogenase E1 component alpha subunit
METALPEESATALADEGIDPAFRGALEVATSLYRQMVRLRLVSARMVELQRAEKIAFHSACLGEEAVIAAAALAARPGDWIFPGVREWGSAIVRGMPVATYVHHAFGNGEDPARGHAAPDHPPARRVNVAPASGVIGAHLPQAVGAAWAAKIKKEGVATFALFGDEATSTGDFHNALNFAGVFMAPCVLVCRNHGGEKNRGVAYGVATARVDGSDALAVLTVLREALARAADGKGATLVEAMTRPLTPSLAPGAWLGPDVLGTGGVDPVARLRGVLVRERLLDAEGAEAIARDARAEIEAAVAAAERAAPLAAATIFENVYAEVPPHLRAQQKESSR